MKLTVFTPTYNRAYIIENLYQSLQRQSCHDFEWLVVDDGSSDNTKELFDNWMKEEKPFPIRYYKQENGGKHRAINYAIPLAEGELFFIVDSDDYLTDDAVETILEQFKTLPSEDSRKYAGICNCKGYSMNQIMGTSFNGDYLDCTALERERHGITGDKAEVVFTYVMKQYPFPDFEGENFITEAVVWDRMAADGFCFRFYNKIVYLCDYRDDGLTKQGMELYFRNPKGWALYLRQCREYKKLTESVQSYFEVQCCLAWIKRMRVSEISKLLGIKTSYLVYKTMRYILRENGSKLKHLLLNKGRRE